MPHLTSIEEFGLHFNEDVDEDVKPTVSRALDLATYYIQEQCECEFDAHLRSDKFGVDDRMPRIANGRLLLRLSSGLVKADPYPGVTTKTPLGDAPVQLGVEDFDIDYRRGYLMMSEAGMAALQSSTIPGIWDIVATFTSGFEVEEDDVGQVYVDVPEDLKDMCLLQAVEVYEKLVDEKEPTFKVLENSGALKRYTRFHSARVLPYNTTLT